MIEYRYASIEESAGALRARTLSAGELAQSAISLLEGIGQRYNAVAATIPDRAFREAAEASRRLDGGDMSHLCGIPYGVKDLFSARGAPTTWGSSRFAARVIDEDATVVRRLGHAGGVLVAKLAMSEFAGGGRPAVPGASMHGQGRNPWNVERYSGGSSSGPAIAVAAGLVPFALGTETGGSVLGPAAFSGVTGMRPTTGLVPRHGMMTLSWSLDKVGVLARSARDCALVLDALLRRPSVGGSFHEATSELALAGHLPLRIAYVEEELNEVAPGMRARLKSAIEDFARLPVRFVAAQLPRDRRFITALELIICVEGAYQFRHLLSDPTIHMTDERQQATLRTSLETNAVEYLEALRVSRAAAQAAFRRIFSHADLLLSPSRSTTARCLSQARPPRDASKHSELLRAAGNLAGVPGISIPAGLAHDGLPIGLQLVGPRGSDRLVIALAAAFQRSTPHHLLRPPELGSERG